MNTPTIEGPDHHDFHDSSLIDFIVVPTLDRVTIVVSTPNENEVEWLWLIELGGVLRLEYENLGIRSMQSNDAPVEIYDIYNDYFSEERSRWIKRFRLLGENEEEAKRVFHIVLASSSVCGWSQHEELEGINIICQHVQIKTAPDSTRVWSIDVPASRVSEDVKLNPFRPTCLRLGSNRETSIFQNAIEVKLQLTLGPWSS